MDPDLSLTVGVVLLVFSLPAIVSAISDGRAPRSAAIVLLVGGVLTIYAINNKQGGYTIGEVPGVFTSVIARYIN